MRALKGLLFSMAIVVASPLMAQTASDPAIGTWKLNPSKSPIPAELGIKGVTRVYTVTADGMHIVETQELTSGGKNVVTYNFKYDGKDSPVTGSSIYDSIAVKEMGKGMAESVMKLKGAPAGTNKREVSKDGKTTTNTTVLKVNGKDVPWTAHYDKQ
jgi:hypothetical protein